MNNKFIDETKSKSRQAGSSDDPGDRGFPASNIQGGRHAPDAAITLPAVPQPRDAGERGDWGVRGPGEARVRRHRGRAPHADQHLHGDTLPSPEAEAGC